MNDLDFDIDVVVTYVDTKDPSWLESFNQNCKVGNPVVNCRYRNWDNLKYFFRGVEKNMPWVRKIHLVLASPSQIPYWLDTTNSKLNIVYHENFIPKELLPTFNTNQIELFLCNIKDLSERFLYFNDDMFVINPCMKSDFFTDIGCVKMCLESRNYSITGQYQRMLYNGVQLLKKYYPAFDGYRTDHSLYVLIKSLFTDFLEKEYDAILKSFGTAKVRTDNDVTLHILREYTALEGWAAPITIKRQCVSLANDMDFPFSSAAKVICFNDNERLSYDFLRVKHKVAQFLERYLPDKSTFEK